jgi:hypothetical protein
MIEDVRNTLCSTKNENGRGKNILFCLLVWEKETMLVF